MISSQPFEGKVAIVTSAAQGIGFAASKALGLKGASLLLGDTNFDEGEAAARYLSNKGITARFMHFDATSEWDVQRFVSYAVQLFNKIDIVVTAPNECHVAPITGFSTEQFSKIFNANVLGTALTIKNAAFHMARIGSGGVIVVVSNIAAKVGLPEMGLYCASQAALVGLTRSLAVELAPDQIRINALLPSQVQTPEGQPSSIHTQWGADTNESVRDRSLNAQPIAEMASAEEIGDGICFLASPENKLLTGASLVWDGGLSSV